MTLEMSTLMGPGVEETDVLSLEGDAALRASLDACVKCTICETQCPVMRVTDLFGGPKYSGPQAERFRVPPGREGHRNHSPPSYRDEGSARHSVA